MEFKGDCLHFLGDRPCELHKQEGVHCDNCPHYVSADKRILIIKLGAIGDVIRTTPLVRKLREVWPRAEISWLTYYPEVIPSHVDHVLTFDLKHVLPLLADHFDIIYNLDRDKEACAVASLVPAALKKGFQLEWGKCWPADEAAVHKFATGLFDDVSRANTKSYLEEIFEMCGFAFSGEEYLLPPVSDGYYWGIYQPRPLVGLNTGCGSRWTTRLIAPENWIALARRLKAKGFGVLLLGGEAEDERNHRIARQSGATYLGQYPLKDFVALVDQCDLVVTGVTMALHLAIGLRKKVVLLNNIFNRHEFELYGRGSIIEPSVECLGCYMTTCPIKCLDTIEVETVVQAISKLLVAP